MALLSTVFCSVVSGLAVLFLLAFAQHYHFLFVTVNIKHKITARDCFHSSWSLWSAVRRRRSCCGVRPVSLTTTPGRRSSQLAICTARSSSSESVGVTPPQRHPCTPASLSLTSKTNHAKTMRSQHNLDGRQRLWNCCCAWICASCLCRHLHQRLHFGSKQHEYPCYTWTLTPCWAVQLHYNLDFIFLSIPHLTIPHLTIHQSWRETSIWCWRQRWLYFVDGSKPLCG